MTDTLNQVVDNTPIQDKIIAVQVFSYIAENIKKPNAIVISYMTQLETIVNEDKENPDQSEYAKKIIALCKEIHSQIQSIHFPPTPNFKEGGYFYGNAEQPQFI